MKKNVIGFVGFVALVALLGQNVFATALSAARDTPSRTGERISLTMASNVIIYAGSLVCVDSSGKANPAADTSGFAVVGRASKTIDNRTAVYLATRTIEVDKGVFRWANADAIAVADIGKIVYVTDDATVNKTGGGQNIIAGTVVDVESAGVWIDTAKVGPIGAATPSSLAVSGAATVGTTLAVTGITSGNELDARTATSLLLGKSVATSVTVGASDAGTIIPGTLAVTGVASFTAIPSFNAAVLAPGTVAGLMTNAPAGATADAKWMKVTYGTTNAVVPMFIIP